MADGQTFSMSGGRVFSGFGLELDRITLERARRGEMAAFAAIYDRFGTACYNLALRVLGEPAAAEDVVQDVFLKLFGQLRGFRGEAPFGAWLKRLTANATIDAVRLQRRFGDDDPEVQFAALPALSSAADVRTDTWSLLMSLPPRARAVVILHEVEGYTHKEIAMLFGQSESYSKSILARAMKRLSDSAAVETSGVTGHD